MATQLQTATKPKAASHLSTLLMAFVVAGIFIWTSTLAGTPALRGKHWEGASLSSLVTFGFALLYFQPLEWWEAAAALAVNVAGGYASGRLGHPWGFLQFTAWGLMQLLAMGGWRAWRRARAVERAAGTPAAPMSWSELHARYGLALVLEDHPNNRRLMAAAGVALVTAGLGLELGLVPVARWLDPLAMGFSFFVMTMLLLRPLRWPEAALALALNAAGAVAAGEAGWPAGFWPCLLWFIAQLGLLFLWQACSQHFVPLRAAQKGQRHGNPNG